MTWRSRTRGSQHRSSSAGPSQAKPFPTCLAQNPFFRLEATQASRRSVRSLNLFIRQSWRAAVAETVGPWRWDSDVPLVLVFWMYSSWEASSSNEHCYVLERCERGEWDLKGARSDLNLTLSTEFESVVRNHRPHVFNHDLDLQDRPR